MAEDHRRCLIVPAAGLGSRFALKGYVDPKPFIPVAGRPMLEVVIRNMRKLVGEGTRVIVVVRAEHEERARRLDVDGLDVLGLSKLTDGAAITVDMAMSLADDDEEVIVANSDQVVLCDPDEFRLASNGTVGTIVTFRCPERDPKWSYAEVNDDREVVRVAEKVAISEHATVGVYRFASKRLLRRAIDAMVARDDRTNGEFYLCPAFNHLKLGGFEPAAIVEARRMYGLGTPEDLERSLANPDFTRYVESLR